MFYLTYRPKTIAELDNESARKTISNVLASETLPHAYTFIGQKGMGKTSTARIFAKAVNCLENKFAGKGTSVEPCNTCYNCVSIDSGHSPDVIEQDAASNRGIDEIRTLIRESAFAPMTCRYRVFIIDEAHMITPEAFNALLKTLEEPPPSVMFILATTNEEKIPKTIASRCFRINFGRAQKQDIVTMLQRIVKAEKQTIDEQVLGIIADTADYSFRDATRMLEELLIQGKTSVAEAQTYLGVRSKHTFFDVIDKKDLSAALTWVHEFSESGGSTKFLIEDLLKTLQQILLKKSGISVQDLPEYSFSTREVAVLMKLLNEAYGSLKLSPIESIPLEIAIVEFYNVRKK